MVTCVLEVCMTVPSVPLFFFVVFALAFVAFARAAAVVDLAIVMWCMCWTRISRGNCVAVGVLLCVDSDIFIGDDGEYWRRRVGDGRTVIFR